MGLVSFVNSQASHVGTVLHKSKCGKGSETTFFSNLPAVLVGRPKLIMISEYLLSFPIQFISTDYVKKLHFLFLPVIEVIMLFQFPNCSIDNHGECKI